MPYSEFIRSSSTDRRTESTFLYSLHPAFEYADALDI